MTYPTTRRVLILQHPQEQDALLGSAQLLVASLPQAKLVVGLSWRNLAHALGEVEVDARRWAVLFPDRRRAAIRWRRAAARWWTPEHWRASSR